VPRIELYRRDASQLSRSERRVLAEIRRPEDIRSVAVEDWWVDDNEICVGVYINRIPLAFWWISLEYAADLFYAKDSERARKRVFMMLQEELQQAQGEEEGESALFEEE